MAKHYLFSHLKFGGIILKDAGNNNAGSIFTSSGKLSSEEKKGQFLNTSA
ncbi:hypothetical protein [Sulfuricurvum sp.]|nr:hypothetical protein [Sulfuricurvum sp.]MDD3598078.1 hypothetical protein [Sulfuricurvum sp.]MDD4885042.1 hypothetical protein [Sulfuricurvum sp.]